MESKKLTNILLGALPVFTAVVSTVGSFGNESKEKVIEVISDDPFEAVMSCALGGPRPSLEYSAIVRKACSDLSESSDKSLGEYCETLSAKLGLNNKKDSCRQKSY